MMDSPWWLSLVSLVIGEGAYEGEDRLIRLGANLLLA